MVSYERLFSGDVEYLRSIYDFLGLESRAEIERGFAQATSKWQERAALADQLDASMRRYLDAHKDVDLEQMAIASARSSS